MIGIFLMILFSLILSFIFFLLNFMISNKEIKIEKTLPFECGVENNFKTRFSFSIHFFIITIIFILFDMEILILLNFILFFSLSWFLFIFFSFFSLFILVTLLYEWFMNFIIWEI